METKTEANFGDFLKDWKPNLTKDDRLTADEYDALEVSEFLKGNAVFQNADTNYRPVIVPIEVGMPATYYCGSDSYATIVTNIEYFKTGERKGQIKHIQVGFPARKENFKPYVIGKSLSLRESKKTWWSGLHLGYARDYQDPHF